jgi:hypothetical protein
MPTNFPTSVDNFTNPTANDSLNLPSHSTQHANANDAIEAIETYMGAVLLNSTSFTAQSVVQIDNVFSSISNNYLVDISLSAITGTNAELYANYVDNGTAIATNYKSQRLFFSTSTATVDTIAGQVDRVTLMGAIETANLGGASTQIKIFNPNVAQPTSSISSSISGLGGSALISQQIVTLHTGSLTFEGIKFAITSGTMTGKVNIYRLGNV